MSGITHANSSIKRVASGAPYAGASTPGPSLVPACSTPPRLTRASSRCGRPGPGGSPGTGALRSLERSAGAAPLRLLSAGVDEPRSPIEVAQPPPPPEAATPPLWSSVVPGNDAVTPPWSLHLHPPSQVILPVLRIGIANVHVPCHGHGHLGGGSQKTATCPSNLFHHRKTPPGRGIRDGVEGA